MHWIRRKAAQRIARTEVVMKAKSRRIGRLARVAAWGTVAFLAVPGAASAANGGTIHFSGALVGPQFNITTVRQTPAPRSDTLWTGHDGSAVTVTFAAPPGGAPSADVTLRINDGAASRIGAATLDTVATSFIDGTGRTARPGADGQYHVGGAGGVLSLGAKSGNVPSANKPVTVVVSYD